MNTGTLTPYMSKGNYTEAERTVLNYFFTNIDKNVYCAKTTMSDQLRAFLMWQYSRTHVALRDRFLQLFADQKRSLDKWDISEEEYISLEALAEAIQKQNGLQIEFFEKKAGLFLKKYGIDYGHASLKDADTIRFAIEWVSQVLTKVLESPFPALGSFQEKSTRYIAFGKESLIFPDEVNNSPHAEEIKEFNNRLIETNQKYLPIVKQALIANGVLKQENFPSEKSFLKTVDAKAFDMVRYLLPSNVSTSLGMWVSTRTAESHISYMLSHSLSEARFVAKGMLEEGLKISPYLLKHVAVNEYQKSQPKELNTYINQNFEKNNSKIYRGISNSERVNILFEWDLDNQILASILFENWWEYGTSYAGRLQLIETMTKEKKEEIMHKALAGRWKYDRMPRALQHASVRFEFLLDFGAYRDIQRHRATQQIRQWVTSIHGYDYPENINLPWLEEFKKDYDDIMTDISIFALKHIQEEKEALQYCTALGHLVRTTYEMHPGQIAYVLELRTSPQSHQSYRTLMQEVYRLIKERAPIFAQYIRVNENLEASRKKEELKKEDLKKENFGK